MESKRKPELLAPAGGWQQLRAAVQNGADAVYLGGPLFNARIRADNFSSEEMKEAICYAHDRNVRVYITLNTLIKDSELREAFSYVSFLYGIGADAVILQDMGLARLVKKYLPGMPMHLSTQGTVYSKEAVESARRLGFSRIVPAREMSLEEIERFSKECRSSETPCEVEVFVHGALCMCYSGQCQMSRYLGDTDGRSGNRGACAQPCRLPYRDEEGKRRFLLSPRDICTLDMIPELCEAGVDSFKIEGRLKSPQYVAAVTSVYRKYIDMYMDTGDVKVQHADMQRLLQSFNRGGFSTGYLMGNPGDAVLSGESPKNQGLYIGRVSGFKKGSTLIDVAYDERRQYKTSIDIGDGVEIRGREITGNVISYLKPLKNSVVRIGDIKGRVDTGDRVFKVTDRELTAEAEKSFADDFRIKQPVRMVFTARKGEVPRLEMEELTDGGAAVEVHGTEPVQDALNRPLESDRIRQQLSKLGDTVFEAAVTEVHKDDAISIPISVINRMRRDAADALIREKRAAYDSRRALTDKEIEEICRTEELGERKLMNSTGELRRGIYLYSRESVLSFSMKKVQKLGKRSDVYIPLELYMERPLREELKEKLAGSDMDLIPYILNISKGRLDEYIEGNFEEIVREVKDTGIMAGNLGWIAAFLDAGVRVCGDYGLNVYNSQSLKAFGETGVEVRAFSHEAGKYHSGSIPLMITEHPVTAKRFSDRKGAQYRVLKWHSGDKYLIFAEDERSGENVKKSLIHYIV